MKFYEYLTLYDIGRLAINQLPREDRRHYSVPSVEDFYNALCAQSMQSIYQNSYVDAKNSHNQIITEENWINNKRPYYQVWPGITKYLARLKEDKVKTNQVKLPMTALAFRFAEEETYFRFEDNGKTFNLRSILVFDGQEHDINNFEDRGRALTLWMDFGETDELGGRIHTYRHLPMADNISLEEAMNSLKTSPSYSVGLQVPFELTEDAVRLVCTACLLANNADEDLVEPDVLADDRIKFDQTGDNRYVEKAHRRGKVGWNIGKHLEVNPHYRGPSPTALYWSGPGKTIPIIRFRKGTIVHRKKVKEIPTDYQDK